MRRRKRLLAQRITEGFCDFCGRDGVPIVGHGGEPLCKRCYSRWQHHGFTGNGPGPEFVPAIERARENADVILGCSAPDAAAMLGTTSRSVQRYRALLRKEANADTPIV
jgi:hypothetical protein